MLRKGVPFSWGGGEQDKVFLELIKEPILAIPNYNEPFKNECDACGYGIDCCLLLILEGKDRVTAYRSMVFKSTWC